MQKKISTLLEINHNNKNAQSLFIKLLLLVNALEKNRAGFCSHIKSNINGKSSKRNKISYQHD